MSGTLNPKQQRFVQEYLLDLNGKQAAIRAGYSEKTAEVQASRLLSVAKVSEAVAAAQAKLNTKLQDKYEITKERVLREYARLAFLDIRKIFDEEGNLRPIHEMDDDTAAAISGLEVEKRISAIAGPDVQSHTHKIKLADKKGALDSIAKMFGWVVDKKEVTGKDGAPLIPVTKAQRDAAVAAALAADS